MKPKPFLLGLALLLGVATTQWGGIGPDDDQIIPDQAIEELILAIEDSPLDNRRKRPLQASLEAALASVERERVNAAVNQLQAFQNKTEAQVTPIDAQLAEDWIGVAQEIINALLAGNVTVTIAGANAAPADLAELPLSVTFNGSPVDLATVTRPSQQVISFDFPTYGLAPGDYAVEATFAAPSGLQSGTFTIHPSILLMIVDDWGHDASPLDNTEPGECTSPTCRTLTPSPPRACASPGPTRSRPARRRAPRC
jgi:hypothetical protein